MGSSRAFSSPHDFTSAEKGNIILSLRIHWSSYQAFDISSYAHPAYYVMKISIDLPRFAVALLVCLRVVSAAATNSTLDNTNNVTTLENASNVTTVVLPTPPPLALSSLELGTIISGLSFRFGTSIFVEAAPVGPRNAYSRSGEAARAASRQGTGVLTNWFRPLRDGPQNVNEANNDVAAMTQPMNEVNNDAAIAEPVNANEDGAESENEFAIDNDDESSVEYEYDNESIDEVSSFALL